MSFAFGFPKENMRMEKRADPGAKESAEKVSLPLETFPLAAKDVFPSRHSRRG